MDKVQHLLRRLDQIGQSLGESGAGLALLGLGSVGVERDRLDQYSDLDFFAIVMPGHKQAFLRDLNWLHRVHPVVYLFANTVDGYKLLFEDGVFTEFAVFEPQELEHIDFAEGKIIWQREGFDASLLSPPQKPLPQRRETEWLIGEALTNLYVGLLRYHRGEKLSAQRFIQHYAVDRILELAPLIEAEAPGLRDAFAIDRRFEQRFPALSAHLPDFVQGYEQSRESASAILQFLTSHFEVNTAIKMEIEQLL